MLYYYIHVFAVSQVSTCYIYVHTCVTQTVCYFHSPAAEGNLVTLTGRGSIPVYQQALSSVTYINLADEPNSDIQREIVFQVYDGQQASNEVRGYVNISLVNDNRLMLLCDAGLATFVEGSDSPISLVPSLSLIDRDLDHVVSLANVTIQNPQDGDRIQVNSSVSGGLVIEQSGGVSIIISGEGMAAQYEVSGEMVWQFN